MRSANDYTERLRNKLLATAIFPSPPPESLYAQVLQGRQPYVIPTPTGSTVDPACGCAEQTIRPVLVPHHMTNHAVQTGSHGTTTNTESYLFENNGTTPITVTMTRTDGSLLLSPPIGPGETYVPYPNQGYSSYTVS
jgi:hypothetical protein